MVTAMLADFPIVGNRTGTLSKDVQLPLSFLNELFDFIAAELPVWRDRPERKQETAETILTSQLCAHLNSACKRSNGWDILQFRPEVPDERIKGRKGDLAPAPCDAVIRIEGRVYTDFDILFPIECKRLPTPKSSDRDDREYVYSQHSTTGGIQRFKAGHHGSAHSLGAMIGYVQEDAIPQWEQRIRGWINDLANSGQAGWSKTDLLQKVSNNESLRLAVFRSFHERGSGQPMIELRHFWLEMN